MRRPKLGPFTGVIDQILSADRERLLRVQKQLAKQDLLIVDELGYVPLSKTGAELLFETFSQRYEQGSTMVTSNLPINEWTEVLGSERMTGTLLDRLTHHVHILEDERRQLPTQTEQEAAHSLFRLIPAWRWVQRYGPGLEERRRPHLKPTKKSGRVDET